MDKLYQRRSMSLVTARPAPMGMLIHHGRRELWLSSEEFNATYRVAQTHADQMRNRIADMQEDLEVFRNLAESDLHGELDEKERSDVLKLTRATENYIETLKGMYG